MNNKAYSLSELGISPQSFSANAITVTKQLVSAGYEAYIVGGAIRDLLLGLEPKDFDVATNATPEQVKRVFRRARIIGRRFKIVHIYQGRELIEVTTFRASADKKHLQKFQESDVSGRLLRDNVYGTLEDDVVRRDLTVNAFYYDVNKHMVLDYCDGLQDIKDKKIRLLGDPLTRYQEDPVRMLRAIRFKSKLGFTFAVETEKPLNTHQHLMANVPAARLLEECFKLFLKGYGRECFEQLLKYKLFGELFPQTQAMFAQNQYQCLDVIRAAMKNTDERVRIGKPVSPVFMFAVLLWAPTQKYAEESIEQGEPVITAWTQACLEAFSAQQSNVSIPRRIGIPSQSVITMQPRFALRRGRRVRWMLQQDRFRAAYDLMLLRMQVGQVDEETAQWWTDIQELDDEAQNKKMMHAKTGQAANKKKRRRGPPRKRKKKNQKKGAAS